MKPPDRRARGVEDVPLVVPDVRRLEERALRSGLRPRRNSSDERWWTN
jgi:hypothetical protein